MKLMSVILSFVLLLNGCMVTHNLTTEPQSTVLTQVNEQFGGEIVTITTIRNQVYRGLFRTISSDSLRYVNDLYQAMLCQRYKLTRLGHLPVDLAPSGWDWVVSFWEYLLVERLERLEWNLTRMVDLSNSLLLQ